MLSTRLEALGTTNPLQGCQPELEKMGSEIQTHIQRKDITSALDAISNAKEFLLEGDAARSKLAALENRIGLSLDHQVTKAQLSTPIRTIINRGSNCWAITGLQFIRHTPALVGLIPQELATAYDQGTAQTPNIATALAKYDPSLSDRSGHSYQNDPMTGLRKMAEAAKANIIDHFSEGSLGTTFNEVSISKGDLFFEAHLSLNQEPPKLLRKSGKTFELKNAILRGGGEGLNNSGHYRTFISQSDGFHVVDDESHYKWENSRGWINAQTGKVLTYREAHDTIALLQPNKYRWAKDNPMNNQTVPVGLFVQPDQLLQQKGRMFYYQEVSNHKPEEKHRTSSTSARRPASSSSSSSSSSYVPNSPSGASSSSASTEPTGAEDDSSCIIS